MLGGIEIEYELLNGDIVEDGIPDLGCRSSDIPKRFELKDNEGIINIEGVGASFVQKIMFESSFGRKVKQGLIDKYKDGSDEASS